MLRLLTSVRLATAAPLVPRKPTLEALERSAARCRACPLWGHATQTVFGQGSPTAPLVLVGEQPGHDEDLSGHPFVGPTGRVLEEALALASLDRASVYLTNVVKHFKWTAKDGRRVHAKPSGKEVGACLPWLEAELQVLKPRVLLCLGSTAAQALLGKTFRVTRHHGEFTTAHPFAPLVGATVHPSAILRAPTGEARREAMDALVADLKIVARALAAAS
jgi:DNA polymerase